MYDTITEKVKEHKSQFPSAPIDIYFRQLNILSIALQLTWIGAMKHPGCLVKKSLHTPLNPMYIMSSKSQVLNKTSEFSMMMKL